MDAYYSKVREYLLDLNISIIRELPDENMMVVDQEEAGIRNMVLVITDPILIMEQAIFEVKEPSVRLFESLLKKNRDIVHGAFALDDSGKKVIFRDTLQLENLDLNELDGSFKSLELLLNEYSEQLLEFPKS
ncbi:type III secretion system chaperone family protein [Nafulsella turpanensis]|uniref:hypothetical protein n=1 Tax=Nafulsella turpanensis TaxID=1265690 RepID=UPI0003480DE1|nr:hypothetical protein [Nafulsella turpanensis]